VRVSAPSIGAGASVDLTRPDTVRDVLVSLYVDSAPPGTISATWRRRGGDHEVTFGSALAGARLDRIAWPRGFDLRLTAAGGAVRCLVVCEED
jgi:hypothetical protein